MQWLTNWWNLVFHNMMGGSILLMFMFGWEIFLIPITIAIGAIGMVIGVIVALVKEQRNKGQ